MRGCTGMWRIRTWSWEASVPRYQPGRPSTLVLPSGHLLFPHLLTLLLLLSLLLFSLLSTPPSSGALIFAHCPILVQNANHVGQIHVFVTQHY